MIEQRQFTLTLIDVQTNLAKVNNQPSYALNYVFKRVADSSITQISDIELCFLLLDQAVEALRKEVWSNGAPCWILYSPENSLKISKGKFAHCNVRIFPDFPFQFLI